MHTEPAAAKAVGETDEPPLLDLRPDSTALFLDCDGTLAEIVDRPADAIVPAATLGLVRRLHALGGRALAIVSGRSLDDIDRLFAPLVLPAAGTHGMERRDAAGVTHRPIVDGGVLAEAVDRLREFAGRHDGIIVETKPSAVTLHYRQRPELQAEATALAARIAETSPGLRLHFGKAVAELGFGRKTKADAIRAFMAEPPFAGRLPLFIGDDVTDEDGFLAVAEFGGIGIKVGDGPTIATARIADPAAVRRWLAETATTWEGFVNRKREATAASLGR